MARAASRPLRVGVDGRELQGRPTGTGRYLRNLLRAWAGEGRHDLLVYLRGAAPADPVLALPGLRPRPLPSLSPGLLWQELRMARAALSDRVDVFFSPAYVCPLRLPVPRVTAVHDLSFFSLPGDFLPLDGLRRRLLVRASVRASRRVLACSEFTSRELALHFPGEARRAVHVPLGADEDLLPGPPREEARAALGVRGPLLLTTGTILNRRRLPVLLQATALLRRRWPALALDVVGENRTHPRLDLAAEVDALGLGGSARLSGFVDEAALALRYAAADVAVFLSEYEGFGLPPMEAAARGVPLVVSSRPSLGEVFAEAALLVEPRDAAAVAEAVDRLLRDAPLRDDRVARGRALAARHSWSETARRTLAVLEEAAG